MRQACRTLSYRDVTKLVVGCLLKALAFDMADPRVRPCLLIQLLLEAAVERRSFSAIIKASAIAPSWEKVRSTLMDQLPQDPLQMTHAIEQSLHAQLPKSLAQRPRPMAIDYHLRPFYGNKKTKGTVRSQRKNGTRTFFAYATLIVLSKGRTFTVALTPVRAKEEQTDILSRLLAQASMAGLRPKVLFLDREFYAALTIRWLQEQKIAFVMPMIRRGKKAKTKAKCTGTQKFFVSRRRGWDRHKYTVKPRGKGRKRASVTVEFDVCMVPKTQQRRNKRRGPLVFACHKIHWPSRVVAERYSTRFGVETSYRQVGQSLAKTTSQNASYRLLLMLVALVIRNMWVSLHWKYFSHKVAKTVFLHFEKLRLEDMTRWIRFALEQALRIEPRPIAITAEPQEPYEKQNP